MGECCASARWNAVSKSTIRSTRKIAPTDTASFANVAATSRLRSRGLEGLVGDGLVRGERGTGA